MRESFLYMNIYDELKRNIDQGVYPVGGKIPSDEELVKKFEVSRITVKKALGMLKEEGMIRRTPGVGTFVKNKSAANQEDAKADAFQSANTIGLVMEHVSSSFGLDLLYKIDREAEKKGYKLITRFSYYSREKETQEIDFLVDSNISGLIIMPCHGVYYNPKILKLILEGFPVVVIDKKLEGISVPSVRTDNIQAVKTLVKVLRNQGCRKLGFISTEIVGTSSLQERRNGFYEAAGEYAVQTLPECILAFDADIYGHAAKEENVDKAARYLEENKGKVDGLVCAEYSLVPSVMEALRRTGAKVGESIKICCIDGPGENVITHMKQNEIEMADKIVRLLMAQIKGANAEKDILVPAVLVDKEQET